jgi:hypothetical protein
MKSPANDNDRPMAMTVEEAAHYVGCRSPRQFRSEVVQGIWPKPIAPNSRPQRWSLFQLDQALRGQVQPSTDVNDTVDDPFLEILHHGKS